MLTLYRQLIALRRAQPALHWGDYEALESEEEVLAYARNFKGQRVVVLLNFGTGAQPCRPRCCRHIRSCWHRRFPRAPP